MCKKVYLDEKEIEKYLDYITSGDVTVATFDDYGIEVILYYGEDPTIVVTQDNIIVYSTAVYKENYDVVLGYIEDEFLTDSGVIRNFLDDVDYGYDEDPYRYGGFTKDDAITDRENELDELVYDFIEGALAGDYCNEITDDVIQECKEYFLEHLYLSHGIEPYRPMVLCDEMGNEKVFDFPYAYVCGEA